MKTIQEKLVGLVPARRHAAARWLKPVLALALAAVAGVAAAQPANDDFTNAITLLGSTGSVNGTNNLATLEDCETNQVKTPLYGLDPQTNSVWFKWTAPTNGTIELDTAGSAIEVVLSVWTVPTTTNGLCDASLTNVVADDDSEGAYSEVNFPVKKGTTYYLSVASYDDGTPGDNVGAYQLNWTASYPTLPSGVFKLTSTSYVVSDTDSSGPSSVTVDPSFSGGRVTVTRPAPAYGRVLVDYAVGLQTYTNTFQTNFFGTNILLTVTDTNGNVFVTNYYSTNIYALSIYQSYIGCGYQAYFVTNGFTNSATLMGIATNATLAFTPLVPVTNQPPQALGTFNLGSGSYTDASSNMVVAATNSYNYLVTSNQIVPSGGGITPVSGTLVFDNFQMSQDIVVPVSPAPGPDAPVLPGIPSYAVVALSNPRLDPLEDSNQVMAPSLDPLNHTGNITALSTTYGTAPAGVFNLERSTFRVDKNVNGTNAIINVNRVGGDTTQTVSVDYSIDPGPGLIGGYNPPCTFNGGYAPANTFPLQAGSDYATPNSDYTPVSGTLSWGAGDTAPKQITIPIINNGAVEFNEDLLIQLSNPQPGSTAPEPAGLGEVNSATLTILFDDTYVAGGAAPGQQPAGAVDRSWNRDNFNGSTPPFLNYPGTTPGFGGTVYAVAEQPDGNAIIAGSFVSFDSTAYNRIVRTLPNGFQDPTFLVSPNSGANDFIAAVALQPDGRIIIGGNFTAFNGYNRHYIARLNTDGSLDTTFNPGLGANGRIWSLAFNPNTGQTIIAGEFTTYNGVAANQVARLNADGSLDTSFVCAPLGTGTNLIVDAVVLDASGRILIGGNFDSVSGVDCGAVARLNADGSLDTTFAPGIGTFNPESFDTDPVKAIAVQPDGRIIIGGSFSDFALVNYNGIARLNPDGTVDLTFQPGTGTLNPVTGVADTVYTMLIQPDGNILVGGDFTTFNQTRRVGLARLLTDGTLDTSFMDTAYNQFAGVPNRYFNPNAVAQNYPYDNTRNAIYALALESASTTGSNILIGGSFTRVGGGTTRDDIRPRSNVARVIGGMTPGPGNIEFADTSYSVNNSDGSLYVSLVRANGNLGPASATFSTNTAAPGPGIASGKDFSLNPAYSDPTWGTAWTATWTYDTGIYGPNQQTTPVNTRGADVYITVTNSGNISGNLSANFELSHPNDDNFALGHEYIPLGTALGSEVTAPLTIIDSNVKAGVLGFSSPTYSVVENGSTATITVTRTNGSDNSVDVFYATSNGTATNGVDYTGVTNSITLGIGETSGTFTVKTLGHYTSVQPDKTVNLRLFTPDNGALLGASNAVLTLINPNYSPGHLGFSVTNYSVAENAGPAIVTVNRLGGSATTLGVTLQTVNGTAVNGVNYTGLTTNLFWNSGDTTSRIISIPVKDDGVVTPNLIAFLQLTNSQVNGTNNATPLSFGSPGSPTNATLTVLNVDSAGSVQFSSPVYSVKKYAGYALVPVTRTGGSIGTVTVNFTTADDTAVQGVNYTTTAGTLTFTNGQVSQVVTVPILPTGNTNGLKDLFLRLSTNGLVTLAALGNPTNAVLDIIDSDSVNEPPGSGDPTYSTFAGFNNNVYALALEPNNQLLVGGDFTMANGVARNRIARLNSDGTLDADFSLPADTYGADGSVRAIALQADGRILIGGLFANFNSVARNHVARINPDGTLDNLFNPGAGADNSVYAVAQTFVAGNPMVMVAGAFASINGTTFNGVGRLTSVGLPDTTFNPGGLGANAAVYAMAVQSDGKIVIGGDFTTYNGATNFNHIARLNVDGTVDTNFNVSASGASDSVRAIALQLDGRILIGGLFTNVNGVALSHIARLNPDGTVDATFTPGLGAGDSVLSLAIQSDTRIVVGGEFTDFSGVTRNRITRLNPDGTVDPSINFGTGANNFVAAIAIQADTITGYPTNVPDEKIIIGGGFTQYDSAPHAYLARIFGGSIGGAGAFQFSASDYFVDESGTNVLITVLRTGGTTNAPTGDIMVNAYTSGGSAVPGTNYIPVSTNLDFPLGEVVRTFLVPVMDDGVVTPDLTVGLAITNPTPPAAIGDQPTAVLHIRNDDTTISFSSATYSVPKNIVSGVAPINLILTGSTNTTASVSFTTTGGTAVPNTDYTPVAQTVTFTPGVTNIPVYIPINNNGIPEGNRTVTMQISGASGSTLAPPTAATLTIIDTVNAPGQLSFASPTYSVTEGGGVGYTNVYITIQRAFGSSGTVSVGFSTQDGSATAGAKYLPTNGVVSFADGESSKTLFVEVRNTPTAEGPETFFVNLFNPTDGATLAAPITTAVTIYNTNTGVAFASATSAFTEPSGAVNGTLLLNVVRFNNTNGTTTVNYSTTNGTAVAGVNFVGVANGTVTFNPGDSTQSVAIATIHDPLVTGDLTFTVGLANPSGTAQLTSPSFTVVTDHDADAGLSFAASAVTVYRNAGFVTIPVQCSNPSAEPISVTYSTGGGTAVAGRDYTAETGTLTFTNGTALNYFYVPILLNNSVQSNRTFNVTLSNPTAPGVLAPPSVETVTIIGTNTPPGLSFSTPIIISGIWGTTNVDNTQGAAESGDPNIAGFVPTAPVWFEWTAPPGADGEVTLDTINSLSSSGLLLDTVLGVYTGNSLSGLSQVAANDDLYPNQPETQYNEAAQNIFNTNAPVVVGGLGGAGSPGNATAGEFGLELEEYNQPFAGPSGLRFNAKGGTTYYIAADTKATASSYIISNNVIVPIVSGRGPIQLSWAYHPSGVFRFATENIDLTGNSVGSLRVSSGSGVTSILSANGNPTLLYQCAESEGEGAENTHRVQGMNVLAGEEDTTLHSDHYYDVPGLLVTVTRVAGSSGRVSVDYTTVDGSTNAVASGDVPAHAGIDYTAVSGTLIFDDFEMSKTIYVPIIDDNEQALTGASVNTEAGQSQPNRDFMVVLSNPQRDPAESGSVSPPRVDSVFGQALCRILDCDIDPKGPSSYQVLTTNITFNATNVFTNTVVTLIPTNGIFNLSKANYRVSRDVQDYWGSNTPVTVYVNRSGTNRSSVTIHYRFNDEPLENNTVEDDDIYFPLQPGSDYAVPTPATAGAARGTNSDFDVIGGNSGTLTFGGGPGNGAFGSQPIHFNVHNNHQTSFAKDLQVTIYELDANGNPQQDGMVDQATVTILFDDLAPPAGSVDELYNPDLATDLAFLTNSLSLNSTVVNPGTDPLGEVYALALTTNNQAIIAGAFSTYTDSTNTYTVNGIARINSDGSLDPSFTPNSGINVFPGNDFIRSLALTPDNKIVIGGDFASYNGIQRNGVARLNADGTLDTAFTPGAGVNGTVWNVQVQTDGKVLIGGDFTTFNGATANHIARLNTDGSLDNTFNASNVITGPVYTMSLSPYKALNFNHASNGSTNEDDQTINLGLQTAGVLSVTYNVNPGPDDLRLYYGDTNVAGGSGVLLFDSGAATNSGFASVPFGTTNGLTTNLITVVMNAGGTTVAPPVLWSYNISMPGQPGIMIGGSFGVAGTPLANVARLNQDGTVDGSFNPGTGPNGPVLSLGWQPDNRVIVGGSFKSITGVALNNLARLNYDGSIDTGFYNGIGTDNSVDSITLQPVSGLIYVGGPFTSMNGTHRLGFARLNTDGTVDTTFLDAAYNQFAGLPRIFYGDPPGVVYASAIQSDGNVLIGGSFQEVGGGQVDPDVRAALEEERGLQPSTADPDLYVADGADMEPKSRDGVRNRSNLARLIGGVTPGPGNIGMVSTNFAVNKTQIQEPVNLVRNNGSLGYASANFSIVPGLAQSGTDYSYSSPAPLYPIAWEYSGPTHMHSDGLFGSSGLFEDIYGELFKYGINGPASINIGIINDPASSGNLSAQLQMANPSQADEFYLGGQDIPVGVALGISQAPLTLVDNTHQDGVFSFAAPAFVATNTPLTVTVTRTNGSAGSVQLDYQTVTNGGSAVPNVDYRPANGVMNFAAAQPSGSFPVTILNNSYISAQEKTVAVQLYNIQDLSGGNAQLGLTNAIVRIINPNYPGFVSFNTNAYYGNLSAGAINFTVTRTVGAKGTVSVQYGTANGTAQNGVDYTGSTNTLTWFAGDVSPRTVSIPLINHNSVGPNKQFSAKLFNATLNGTNTASLFGITTNAIFAILNDNSYGTFQFSSPSYQVNEGGGYATISVTRGGSGLGTASVAYSTLDGTAFAGTNYVATNNTLTFQPGQLMNSFNVRLLNDGKTNPPPASFYFAVALANPSAGAALGSPTNSPVHIVDASTFNQPPGNVDPSFGASANASVLALAQQSDGQIVAGGSFTVADGTSINRLARFNTDGSLDEGFLNGLSGADDLVNAVVSQTDDRIVVGGAFATLNGFVRHRIARLMTDGTLDSSFNSGSGADNTVYSLAEAFINGSRYIYAGGAFSTIDGVSSPGVVRLNDNGLVDTSFTIGQGAVGPVYAVAAYPTNSVYNAGKVLVGGQFTNFNGTVVGNLVRLNPDGSMDTNFNRKVTIDNAVRAIAIGLDDSVLVGGDFLNVNGAAASHIARLNADGTLDGAFNAASAPGVNGTVNTILIQPDNRIVLGGQFSSANGVSRGNITRLLPTGAADPAINFGLGANGGIKAALIQAADGMLVIGGDFTQFNGVEHDHIARLFGGSLTGSGTFQFTTGNYQIDENANFATVTVERTGGTAGPNPDGSGDVFVAFSTANGSAVAGVNYSPTTNYIDFPAGEVLRTVYVEVIDDGVITPNLTVNLALSNPTPGTSLGDQPTALLTIINDDSDVEFVSPTYVVAKNTVTGLANIQLERIGSTSGACTVEFMTGTNGTAMVGTDYSPTNVLVTFNPGESNETVQVVITNNLVAEGNRTVAMMLTNALNTILEAPSNAVLTIQDTVVAPGNLFFAATNFSADASDGLAYLTVNRTNGTSGPISVTYTTTTNGTAQAGHDYVASTGVVDLNDGDTSKTFTITLVNNSVAQGAVTFGVQLSDPTGGAGLIAPTNAIVTIYNTNAAINFAFATNTVSESASPATIVVQRFNNTNVVSTVNYATTDGTAVAGVNYSNTFGMLTFGIGEVYKSISVPLINQSNITALAFGMSLSSAVHGQLIAPSNTVIVLEPSAAGISLATNSATVLKNAGSLQITVSCSNPGVEPAATGTNLPLEVAYTTVDGTAKAGLNYQPMSGTLIFTNGNATNTFFIPIFNNVSVSSNLTFSVALTNVTAPGIIEPYGTEAVVIKESNAGLSFSQPAYTVYKNGGNAVITVYRTGYTDSVVSVNYLATNGTAISGQNFYATNGTLIFTNGVTSQAFNVPLIANTQVQPNLFALLSLNSPNNAQIVNPGAATLTILETGGSYVIPAGAQLLANSSAADAAIGVIGSNDTVQVMFAFRDSAGLNVTNLIAYLQATNGVAAPSPASQIYGPLTVYGHSVSRPFSFLAQGTNSYNISPTFLLYDNGKFIGPATFTFTLGSWTTTFANTTSIIINDNAAASPYPSIITVAGAGDTLVKATITVTNLSHKSMSDIDALVVSPTTNTLIMAHAGGSGSVATHVTLTFDDAATNTLPQFGQIVTGTNKPTQFYPVKNFP